MTELAPSSQSASDHLLRRAVDRIPGWALGTIGTLVGFALAISLFLTSSGLGPSTNRILEAWSKRIETQTVRVGEFTNQLEESISRLERTNRATAEAIKKLDDSQRLTAEALKAMSERLVVDEGEIAALRVDVDGLKVKLTDVQAEQSELNRMVETLVRSARTPPRPTSIAPATKAAPQPAAAKSGLFWPFQ